MSQTTQTRFRTIDGESLMSCPLQPLSFVVDSLLATGLHVLAGSPKVGKSWLALWLSVMVANGKPVWGMNTRQGTTLYLCTEREMLGGGLEEKLQVFLTEHPDTVLVIIDTLQMVRNVKRDNTYANDYNDLSALKKIADRFGIALLVIHHLRKEPDDDVFNRISGTTAISGAVDSSFMLVEEKRGSGKGKLYCIGRDIEYREIELERNEDNVWELVSDSLVQPELLEARVVFLISELLRFDRTFIGTPTELSKKIDPDGTEGLTPKKVSREILENVEALKRIGISFAARRSNGKRLIELHRADSVVNPGVEEIVPIDPDEATEGDLRGFSVEVGSTPAGA